MNKISIPYFVQEIFQNICIFFSVAQQTALFFSADLKPNIF